MNKPKLSRLPGVDIHTNRGMDHMRAWNRTTVRQLDGVANGEMPSSVRRVALFAPEMSHLGGGYDGERMYVCWSFFPFPFLHVVAPREPSSARSLAAFAPSPCRR